MAKKLLGEISIGEFDILATYAWPVSFGVVKDGKRDAVLDPPAGVQELTLAEDGDQEPGSDPGEAHHRSAADMVEDRWGCVHPQILPMQVDCRPLPA